MLTATQEGRFGEAEQLLTGFLEEKFSIQIGKGTLKIRQDSISLNSVNGFYTDRDGRRFFFKFHMEKGEEHTVKEYYNARHLEEAGYPVEMPVHVSTEPGQQILVYNYMDDQRFFDLCDKVGQSGGKEEIGRLVAAEDELNRICAERVIETLHDAGPAELAQEPILQLFYWRLVDKQDDSVLVPGGRHHSFYVGKDFKFPGGLTLSYGELADLKWNINGRQYNNTLQSTFDRARELLAPGRAAHYAACTSHGDDHNGNKWGTVDAQGAVHLRYFDPAFAGKHIPALLAGVKTLFHDTLAHEKWLYDSRVADGQINAAVDVRGDTIYVTHDWALSDLRFDMMASKRDLFWTPVVQELQARRMLPDDWEEYVRAALFCCPTLVMNLRANAGTAQNTHTPRTSALGLSIAMMLASRPAQGQRDLVSDFFGTIRNSLEERTKADVIGNRG